MPWKHNQLNHKFEAKSCYRDSLRFFIPRKILFHSNIQMQTNAATLLRQLTVRERTANYRPFLRQRLRLAGRADEGSVEVSYELHG